MPHLTQVPDNQQVFRSRAAGTCSGTNWHTGTERTQGTGVVARHAAFEMDSGWELWRVSKLVWCKEPALDGLAVLLAAPLPRCLPPPQGLSHRVACRMPDGCRMSQSHLPSLAVSDALFAKAPKVPRVPTLPTGQGGRGGGESFHRSCCDSTPLSLLSRPPQVAHLPVQGPQPAIMASGLCSAFSSMQLRPQSMTFRSAVGGQQLAAGEWW